jgi:hypothetical protein
MTSPRVLSSLLVAAAASLAWPSAARADDGTRPQSPTEPTGARTTKVTLLGEGPNAMRFQVLRDRAAGRMTFRLLDRRAKLGLPPVAIVQSATGPREIPLVAVDGSTDSWTLTDALAKAETFDGTLRVMVDGKPLTGPIVVSSGEVEAATPAAVEGPPHGGRWIVFDECNLMMEAVQDFETGTITFYGSGKLDRPPAVTISEGGGVTKSESAPIEGKTGVWKFTSSAFKRRDAIARVRILVDGRGCEAALTIPPHGGRILVVADGPQIEVVRTDAGAVRFFVLEDRIGERPFVVENPSLVTTTAEGDRMLALTAVRGETRAWEIAKLDVTGTAPLRLRFTNGGRVVETPVAASFFATTR